MVIDRIEGDVAVVELARGEYKNVPLADITGSARDGAVLVNSENGYAVDERATAERLEASRARLQNLFETSRER